MSCTDLSVQLLSHAVINNLVFNLYHFRDIEC